MEKLIFVSEDDNIISVQLGSDGELLCVLGYKVEIGLDYENLVSHFLRNHSVKLVARVTKIFTDEERADRARLAQGENQIPEVNADPVPVDTGITVNLRDKKAKSSAISTTTANGVSWKDLLQKRIERDQAKAYVAPLRTPVEFETTNDIKP